VQDARWLFTNEYEAALLREHTGWSEKEVLQRVGTWIVTRGAEGVSLLSCDAARIDIPAVPTESVADPTGVGDAFRAGFLAGIAWELPYRRAAQLGCALATVVIESIGTQEYKLTTSDLVDRLDGAYGRGTGREIEPLVAVGP
jgi:adenosine kinase